MTKSEKGEDVQRKQFSSARKVRKCHRWKRKNPNKSVMSMLLMMKEQSPDSCRDVTQDFLTTGRAGRRNALPDILGEHAVTTVSDLPERLQCLSVKDEPGKSGNERSNQGTSSQINPGSSSGSHHDHDMSHSSGSSKS